MMPVWLIVVLESRFGMMQCYHQLCQSTQQMSFQVKTGILLGVGFWIFALAVDDG
jgi:hypothetical protein